MLKKYDFLFSVGKFCLSSQMLRKRHLQHESFPFDWMMFEKFEGVIDIWEDAFADLANPKYLKMIESGSVHNSYYHKKYQMILHHDFRKDCSDEENLRAIRLRYKRRFERLDNRIKSAKTILAVHCEENSDLDAEAILVLFSRLQSLCAAKHLDMVFFNLDERIATDSEEQLSEHIRKVNVAIRKNRKYDDLAVAALPYMKVYDTSLKVKIIHMFRSSALYIRKVLLKLLVVLPLPKKYKQQIKMIYKDKFRA